MNRQVAIFVDNHGESTLLQEAENVNVYVNEDENWHLIKNIPFALFGVKDLNDTRERISKLIESLDNCNIIVGEEFTGLIYTVFHSANFKIIEASGKPEEFLDELIVKLEEYEAELLSQKAKAAAIEEPVALDKEGYYYLDLNELQKNNSSISSKQALVPFLKNKTFYELQVICSHVPPWLENELEKLGYNKNIEQLQNNQFKISITKKVCNC